MTNLQVALNCTSRCLDYILGNFVFLKGCKELAAQEAAVGDTPGGVLSVWCWAGMVGLCLEDVSNFADSVIPPHACLVGKGHQQNWCLESICSQQWFFTLVYLCLK